MYRVGWALAACLYLVPATAGAQGGQAQEAQPRAARAQPAWQPAPWMLETGRVGNAAPDRQSTDIGAATASGSTKKETPVHRHASEAASTPAVEGRLNQAVLEVEAEPYLRQLRACPVEVARHRQ